MKRLLFVLSTMLFAGIANSQDLTKEQIIEKLSTDRINRTVREYISLPKGEGVEAVVQIAICAEFIKDLPGGEKFQEAKASLLEEYQNGTDMEKDILLLNLVDGWLDFYCIEDNFHGKDSRQQISAYGQDELETFVNSQSLDLIASVMVRMLLPFAGYNKNEVKAATLVVLEKKDCIEGTPTEFLSMLRYYLDK